MKTRQLTQDQLAKFMARQLLKIKNYNYDMFYDIAKIVVSVKSKRAEGIETEQPQTKNFYLCVRDMGSDLIHVEDALKDTCFDRSTKVYELNICINSDYLHNVPFCTLKTIK